MRKDRIVAKKAAEQINSLRAQTGTGKVRVLINEPTDSIRVKLKPEAEKRLAIDLGILQDPCAPQHKTF